MPEALLALESYEVSLKISNQWLPVIRGVDLMIQPGEIVGIIGESGSGKSVMLKTMLGLMSPENYRIQAGQLIYNQSPLSGKALEKIVGREIAYVFQNPKQSLSPIKSILAHFKEQFKIAGRSFERHKVEQLLEDVGISDGKMVLKQYPYQISGGQGQRVALALALVSKPKLIIADEPTSAIDASLKRKMITLFKEINAKYQTAIIIITHDFDVIETIAHRVYVMYGGLMLNEGETKHLMTHSVHPYTRGLIQCADALKSESKALYELRGEPIGPEAFTDACPFAGRCERVSLSCKQKMPRVERYKSETFRCCHPILPHNLERLGDVDG